MKNSLVDKMTNLELALENALAIGNEDEINTLLSLLAQSNNSKDAQINSVNLTSQEDITEEKVPKNKSLTLEDFSIDNIEHSLQKALEQGDAKMVDYYMFLLGQGV